MRWKGEYIVKGEFVIIVLNSHPLQNNIWIYFVCDSMYCGKLVVVFSSMLQYPNPRKTSRPLFGNNLVVDCNHYLSWWFHKMHMSFIINFVDEYIKNVRKNLLKLLLVLYNTELLYQNPNIRILIRKLFLTSLMFIHPHFDALPH